MHTPLTMLFPNGLAVRAAACGEIEEIALASPGGGPTTPLTGAVSSADTLVVSGWAADAAGPSPSAGVILTFGGQTVEATYGLPRLDPRPPFDGERLAFAGFHATVAVPAGTVGSTRLAAYAVNADGDAMTPLAGDVTLDVRRADAEVAVGLTRRPGFAAYHVDELRILDAAAGEPRVPFWLFAPRGAIVELRGWVFDAAAGLPARGVYLMIDRRDLVRGTLGYPRPDVGAAQHNARLTGCGFAVRFDTSGLPPGRHRLTLGFVTQDGDARDEVELAESLGII